MEKLIRVSNYLRGKKLIITEGDYFNFISAVKLKFGLISSEDINLFDDQGAEIDQDVFPILLNQAVIPNIEFVVVGEVQTEVKLHSPGSSSSMVLVSNQIFSPDSSFDTISKTDVQKYQQILELQVSESQELLDLVEDCKKKACVDHTAATILTNSFVSKLIELKGPSPSTRDQKLFAKAILEIIPCWRYGDSSEGIDILYDEVNRAGLIQSRLRTIHRNLKGQSSSTPKRRLPVATGGPKPKIQPNLIPPSPLVDNELVVKLNSADTKSEQINIRKLMQESLPHRNSLRLSGDNSILKVYTKFKECDFLVNLEFSLLHPDLENTFLDKWSNFAEKIVDRAKDICKSPAFLKFINEDYGNWDKDIAALFILLHLIPPTAQGKGKGSRCKLEEAKSRIISFFKIGTPLQSILDTWPGEKSQPNLLCIGESRSILENFFIVCDRVLIPLSAKNAKEAIDSLFKSHFVFATEYDANLLGFWKFIQVHIYKLDVGSTQLPRKVKEVYGQLSNLLE